MPNETTLYSNFFLLKLKLLEKKTFITMQLLIEDSTTANFLQTARILEKYLPNIKKHRCFNYLKIPFFKEAQQTEIGHLFEHILLEYLLILNPSFSKCQPLFRGKTNWDWRKEAHGTFNISINTGTKDKLLFQLALAESIALINIILSSKSATLPVSTFQPRQNIT